MNKTLKRKKILLVSNTSWNIYNFRIYLIESLLKNNYEVVLVAKKDDYSKYLLDLGFRYIDIKIKTDSINPFIDFIFFINLIRIFIKERPSVFLGFTIKPNIYGSLAAYFLGAAIINNITGLGESFQRGAWIKSIVIILYKLALRKSSYIFFHNQADINLFESSGIAKSATYALLPGSGIDLVKYDFDLKKILPRKKNEIFNFLFVGRLIFNKGIREYIDSSRIMLNKGFNVKFYILGLLDPDNKNSILPDQLRQWESEGLVTYLGFKDDIRNTLLMADCVVHPSYSEGLPRVLLEAAAMRRPIISTDIPGSNRVVLDGYNGLLIKTRNALDLADKMESMYLTDPSMREVYGRNGREMVITNFGQDIVVNEYLVAIDKLLRGG